MFVAMRYLSPATLKSAELVFHVLMETSSWLEGTFSWKGKEAFDLLCSSVQNIATGQRPVHWRAGFTQMTENTQTFSRLRLVRSDKFQFCPGFEVYITEMNSLHWKMTTRLFWIMRRTCAVFIGRRMFHWKCNHGRSEGCFPGFERPIAPIVAGGWMHSLSGAFEKSVCHINVM